MKDEEIDLPTRRFDPGLSDSEIQSPFPPYPSVGPPTHSTDSGRDYRCPDCGGEFNAWDGEIAEPSRCPFCGLQRQNYDPEESDPDE